MDVGASPSHHVAVLGHSERAHGRCCRSRGVRGVSNVDLARRVAARGAHAWRSSYRCRWTQRYFSLISRIGVTRSTQLNSSSRAKPHSHYYDRFYPVYEYGRAQTVLSAPLLRQPAASPAPPRRQTPHEYHPRAFAELIRAVKPTNRAGEYRTPVRAPNSLRSSPSTTPPST